MFKNKPLREIDAINIWMFDTFLKLCEDKSKASRVLLTCLCTVLLL